MRDRLTGLKRERKEKRINSSRDLTILQLARADKHGDTEG
jgi:hypothetical protein